MLLLAFSHGNLIYMNKDPVWRGVPYTKKNWGIVRIQYYITAILNKFPRLEKVAVFLLHHIRILRYQRRSKKLSKNKDNGLDVDKIFWVDPKKIRYISLKEFHTHDDKGKIINGDWDLLERQFEELDVHIAFKERFIEGKKWETTVYYQRSLNEINKGRFLWDCRNQFDYDNRLKKLDMLFETIKNNGYKLQQEIQPKNNPDPIKIDDEIAVNIGRNGDLLFNNGAHRLSIAKLLNIPKIPIKITVRHPQWVNLREQILLYANDQPSGKIYQPISHIDLQDIPTFHETEISRFEIIRKNLSAKKGRLLDIGAHWGYFCHRFEEIGFDCYAVEKSQVDVYFLEKLRRADNKKFTIIPKSIFDYKDLENIEFDVVLALNIFHHFLIYEESYHELVHLLHKLRVKEMFFEPHSPEFFQDKKPYKNYSVEEFVQFILKNSDLNESQYIGTAQDGRKIYKLFQSKKER
jgi:2-polyprenyl-3-methyl-5-hydroxy-6-metoxy-1,4-benzoquinol methylase